MPARGTASRPSRSVLQNAAAARHGTWLFAFAVLLLAAGAFAGDPYADLVTRLEEQAKDKLARAELRVMVGDFPCANQGSEGISTVSRMLEDRLREALGTSKTLTVIGRKHLEKMVQEKELQSSNLIDPHTIVKINVKGVDALLDGRYTHKEKTVSLSVTLSLLNGGEQVTVVGDVPQEVLRRAASKPQEAVTPQNREDFFQPQNIGNRKLNLNKLAQVNKNLANRKIKAEIWVEGGRNHFLGGEEIRYRVRVDRDCHIAIFCHQIDGTTSRLFPNRHNADTKVQKNRIITIPGDKAGFKYRIGAPFGGDIVQIVACNNRAELATVSHRLEGVRGLDLKQDVFPKTPDRILWGEQHILVYSYPKW